MIELYDWGIAFNQELVAPPKFDGTEDGGFGVYIIANLVDEVSYTRDETGKNCARLKINLGG